MLWLELLRLELLLIILYTIYSFPLKCSVEKKNNNKINADPVQLLQMFGSMHQHQVSAEEPPTFHSQSCFISVETRIKVRAESVAPDGCRSNMQKDETQRLGDIRMIWSSCEV